MNQIFLKDNTGKIKGIISNDISGNKMIKDAFGKILGIYNKSQDITKDAYGRILGKGDLLTSLLK